MVKKSDYDIKKLIMMQKLEPRTVYLKLTSIGHVDRVTVCQNRKRLRDVTKESSRVAIKHFTGIREIICKYTIISQQVKGSFFEN